MKVSSISPRVTQKKVKKTKKPVQWISCVWCPKKFKSSNQWAIHMCVELKKHVGTKCPMCKDTFASSALMSMHVLKRECLRSELRDVCECCGDAFVSKWHKELHVAKCKAVAICDCITDDGKYLFDYDTSVKLDEAFDLGSIEL